MTIPTFDPNRPRRTLPPDVLKQWRAGNIEPSKPRGTDKRPNSYTPLTDSEIHHRVVKWLYYMCGYRSNRVATELHGVSRQTVWYWLKGRSTPRPKNLARLCRDAGWRVRQGFIWSVVKGVSGDEGEDRRLILADKSLCDPDALPGALDQLPTYDDLEGEMSLGGYAGRSLFGDLLGRKYQTPDKTIWHRLAEIRLWFLMGYPVGMMHGADWKERVLKWDQDFTMRPREGWRGIQLPTNPFDFVRTAWNPKELTS